MGGASCGSAWLDSGCGAASAYLIRSRPLGRKINSRACCYRRIRGRAFTRAQHNIYSAGATHTYTHGSTCTCTCLGDKNTEMCEQIHSRRGESRCWGETSSTTSFSCAINKTHPKEPAVCVLQPFLRLLLYCVGQSCQSIFGSSVCLFR